MSCTIFISDFAYQSRQSGARGFTLVELAIVLVIIGLIIGGVLLGRDLIRAAEIRAVTSTVEQYKTAMQTFRTKYNCLPGDCASASSFFSTAINGNNSGIVDSDTEIFETWRHLSLAQLVGGSYVGYAGNINYVPGSNIPSDANGVGYSFFCPRNNWPYSSQPPYLRYNQCYISAADYRTLTTVYIGYAKFSTAETYQLDTKIDDGRPHSGQLMATRQSFTTTNHCTNNNAFDGVSTTATYYQTSNTELRCVVLFVMPR